MKQSVLQVVLRFNSCITNRDVNGLDELMTPDHAFIDSSGSRVVGKLAVLEAWTGFFNAFPDYRNVFHSIEVDGPVVRILGESHCADQRLEGPALWRAVVLGERLSEWRVFEDTADNRRQLRAAC